MKIDKYIYENGLIYEHRDDDIYYTVIYIDYFLERINGNYARARFEFLLENKLEFLADLACDGTLIDYLDKHQEHMQEQELKIIASFPTQNSMTALLAQEILMYQDIS